MSIFPKMENAIGSVFMKILNFRQALQPYTIELNIILSLLDNKMRVNQILGNGNKG